MGQSNSNDVCRNGVPLASHRRCAGCGVLIGCPCEVPAGAAPLLCRSCEEAGVRVGIQGARRKRFLRPAEVAELVGVSRATVIRMIHSGELEAAPLRPKAAGKGVRHLVSEAAVARRFGIKDFPPR